MPFDFSVFPTTAEVATKHVPRYRTVTIQIPAIFWHRDKAWEEERTNTRQRLQSFQTLELGTATEEKASGGGSRATAPAGAALA